MYLSLMVSLVASLTQRDEVVRGIPAGLPGLDVMDVQDLVFGFPVTVLASVSVTEQNVFSGVPEAKLFTFLILCSGDVRIFEQLRVELCNFDDRLGYREKRMDPAYERQV